MGSRINLPARKRLLHDLLSAIRVKNDTGISDLNVWREPNGQNTFSIVWLQAQVVQVDEQCESFILEQDEARCQVRGVSALPVHCPRPEVGRYLMVIGELCETGQLPVVRALKTQELTWDSFTEDLWRHEVLDLRLNAC